MKNNAMKNIKVKNIKIEEVSENNETLNWPTHFEPLNFAEKNSSEPYHYPHNNICSINSCNGNCDCIKYSVDHSIGSGSHLIKTCDGLHHKDEKHNRILLRPWLEKMLKEGRIDGLEWIDKEETMFKVPWKHRSKKDWSTKHSSVFIEWAKNTGRLSKGFTTPNYAQLKTRLRCAFNKAPDIEEMKDHHSCDVDEPYKVYRFKDKKVLMANACKKDKHLHKTLFKKNCYDSEDSCDSEEDADVRLCEEQNNNCCSDQSFSIYHEQKYPSEEETADQKPSEASFNNIPLTVELFSTGTSDNEDAFNKAKNCKKTAPQHKKTTNGGNIAVIENTQDKMYLLEVASLFVEAGEIKQQENFKDIDQEKIVKDGRDAGDVLGEIKKEIIDNEYESKSGGYTGNNRRSSSPSSASFDVKEPLNNNSLSTDNNNDNMSTSNSNIAFSISTNVPNKNKGLVSNMVNMSIKSKILQKRYLESIKNANSLNANNLTTTYNEEKPNEAPNKRGIDIKPIQIKQHQKVMSILNSKLQKHMVRFPITSTPSSSFVDNSTTLPAIKAKNTCKNLPIIFLTNSSASQMSKIPNNHTNVFSIQSKDSNLLSTISKNSSKVSHLVFLSSKTSTSSSTIPTSFSSPLPIQSSIPTKPITIFSLSSSCLQKPPLTSPVSSTPPSKVIIDLNKCSSVKTSCEHLNHQQSTFNKNIVTVLQTKNNSTIKRKANKSDKLMNNTDDLGVKRIKSTINPTNNNELFKRDNSCNLNAMTSLVLNGLEEKPRGLASMAQGFNGSSMQHALDRKEAFKVQPKITSDAMNGSPLNCDSFISEMNFLLLHLAEKLSSKTHDTDGPNDDIKKISELFKNVEKKIIHLQNWESYLRIRENELQNMQELLNIKNRLFKSKHGDEVNGDGFEESVALKADCHGVVSHLKDVSHVGTD